MKYLFVKILFVFLLVSWPVALRGESDIIIDIIEPGTAKIKIGIPPIVLDPGTRLQTTANAAAEFAQVLRDDLDFTGIFEVYPSPPINVRVSQGEFVPLKSWVPLDVQAAFQGRCKETGGAVAFECELYDVESESRIVGKSYKGTTRDVRTIAHAFSDEIVYRYTGKPGIAHTSIAYTREKGGSKEIHIMNYDGHGSYQLTYDKSIALSPSWSPDGTKIVFTSYRDHNPDVYLIDLKARSSKRISAYVGLNTTPVFSPDGKTVALTLSKDGNPELYLLALKDGSLTRLTRNSAADTSPSWSPNGREIAFVSDRSGSPQVYIVDREGVYVRRLTYSGSYNTSPDWSPQGDRIAYVSMVNGKPDIFTIGPTGADARRITTNGGNEDPVWSPDGKYIAFSGKRNGVRDIYLMRADGSGIKQVTFGGGDHMSPAWSS
ncbi:MAG: Tol-Pal system beta propeller repeat protein TolB [Candidatus Abyssobacteria bacterium SURF_5]|uniref:Tol-Pal system beta propeller repeat protein TolB n=1 Tax=Abyssobacteria bacterium (strain SURF_5) TaxID=2093360 RepID=A0A3A4P1J6_ABYX5|nr:MAG: Tol-Pal system beta propeller repeat protein TolB [Candidatus Abyssubacteria bacterium SURF_5]